MLDQNTDRMWYVIGAVLVGAAIILIANGTLPQIFASVTESFEGAAEEVTSVVEDIEPTGYEPTRYTFEGFDYYFPKESRTWLFPTPSYLDSDYDHIGIAYPGLSLGIDEPYVYITDVFDISDREYTISFNAHRIGPWVEIDYALYLGDDHIGIFKAGQTEESYEYDVVSPKDLSELNDLHIRSLHLGGSNAFWMSQLSIEEKGD